MTTRGRSRPAFSTRTGTRTRGPSVPAGAAGGRHRARAHVRQVRGAALPGLPQLEPTVAACCTGAGTGAGAPAALHDARLVRLPVLADDLLRFYGGGWRSYHPRPCSPPCGTCHGCMSWALSWLPRAPPPAAAAATAAARAAAAVRSRARVREP